MVWALLLNFSTEWAAGQILWKDGEILPAVNFNILADVPSGPLAFDVSEDDRRSKTSSSVQNSVDGTIEESGQLEKVRGICEVLKQEWK